MLCAAKHTKYSQRVDGRSNAPVLSKSTLVSVRRGCGEVIGKLDSDLAPRAGDLSLTM